MLIQIMENNEDILQALHEFENMSNAEKFLTQDLEDMLSYIAKTGRVLFPWNSLKPVFLFKLDKVMQEFFENSPSRNATSSEPTVTADFEVMRQRLLDCLDSFTSAPFTIQRLCELMVEPRKNYSNSEKFMRGVEKNVLVVSTVDINRDDLAEMTLTNNVDGQHMLSNLPNGPVTNGIMTYAIPSEGNSVTDHGYNERVSHLTPDSVISQVTPDTSGSTPLNAHENGHDQQEQYNESSLSAAESSPVEESNLPERQLGEEKCERDMNKVEGNVPQEEKAPETESRDPGSCLDAHAEQKSSEEEKPELASEQKTEAVSEQTAEQTEIKETSPSPASEEEEPMDEN